MLFSLTLACAWTPPLDTGADPVLNTIAGTVTVSGADALGPVFVLLYDAADPPPPSGTGRPVNFTAVSPEDFTGAGAGVQSARYTLPAIADGEYLVSAMMDSDGDFSPFFTSTAGSTCGDLLGAHVTDLSTLEIATVYVEGGELLDDVLIGVAQELSTERPAFAFTDGDVEVASGDLIFGIASTGIDSALIQIEGDPTQECGNYFLVQVVDADGDGQPDSHSNPTAAELGFYEIWPKIYLSAEDEGGGSWATEAPIAAAWFDPEIYGAHGGFFLADGGIAAVGGYTPLTTLPPTYLPAAYYYPSDGGSPQLVDDPAALPTSWSVTVVQLSGQTWTVPNEIAGEVASQGERLTVQ